VATVGSVQRDPAAIATLSQAIEALGGLQAAALITDSVVTAASTPVQGSPTKPSALVWEDSQGEFKVQVQEGSSTRVFLSGHGSPASVDSGKVRKVSPFAALANPPVHLPAVVLARVLGNPQYSVVMETPTTIGGIPVIRVKVELDTTKISSLVTPQEWYFNAANGMPVRVDFRSPDTKNPEHYDTDSFDFSNFRPVNNVQVPFQIVYSENGRPTNLITVTAVAFNQGLLPQEFDPPSGGGQ
jgi:uncharacterized cupin superfamily protein